MKKVLVAALMCAVSSFATWDYFPIKEAGKGEAKVGFAYFMQDKVSIMGLNAGARFGVIDGLEVALMFTGTEYPMGFPLSSSDDGNSCKDAKNCPPTWSQPILGLRYWLPMGVGIGLDISLPFQGEAASLEFGRDGAALVITPALQYSNKLMEELELGFQVGLSIPFENKVEHKEGMDLGIGLELDFSLGMVTPFVGVDVELGLTKPQSKGKDAGDAEEMGIVPSVGAIFEINEMLAADVGVGFGLGKRYKNDDNDNKMPIIIGVNVSVNF